MQQFKVGDKVKALRPSTKVEVGNLGVVSGYTVFGTVKVRFDNYLYLRSIEYHGFNEEDLELVTSKKKGLCKFLDKVKKEYSNG